MSRVVWYSFCQLRPVTCAMKSIKQLRTMPNQSSPMIPARSSAKGRPTMPVITEIAPDTYRIAIYVPEIDLQFNHFLIKDDEPLLFATGFKAMLPLVRQ